MKDHWITYGNYKESKKNKWRWVILNAVIVLVLLNPVEVNPITSVIISQLSIVSHWSAFLKIIHHIKKKQHKNQGTVINYSSPNVYNTGHSKHAIPNSSVFYNIELEN